MHVKDLMATKVVSVTPDVTVARAIQVMLAHKISGLPVVSVEGELVGILSEGDFLRRIEFGTQEPQTNWLSHLFNGSGTAEAYTMTRGRKVGEVMSRKLISVGAHDSLEVAVALMERHHIKRLPVIEAGTLVGIITRADFVRALATLVAPAYEEPPTSDEEIKSRILEELAAEAWAFRSSIEVAVMNGHVELRGTVVDDRQRDAARVLAENVIGVQSVIDQMAWRDPVALAAY